MSKKPLLNVYDNVLEGHVAELIDLQMKDVYWQYDYASHLKLVNRHWHVLCGVNEEQIKEKGFEFVLPLWHTALHKYDFKYTYNVEKFKRIYMNAHTHGIEPHEHIDDGDFTMIYYPRLDWERGWGGGTRVGDDLIQYVGNRLIVFSAHTPHQAMPVSRECYELRTVIVFKTYVDGANYERLDFYKD